MNLACKTRGGSRPQGKPRVYCTGHPADMELYNSIAAEILAVQNCAVYYDEKPWEQGETEEFLRQLEGMQLFVIPVTSNFLRQPNRALEMELPFARERHIPVLPLMQEPGLEDLFNKMCGNLQILGRGAAANSEKAQAGNVLSYEEKLEKFLSSVLVEDALAEKVRLAFDAYIFLSYRKIDREYAQKLMRLIHENDFCRDIAIWYDEFLVPGENFGEAIRQALEQSHLVALAVTENLLEAGNFVLTKEYPMARQAGKLVFPALLRPTDQQELRVKYRGLPPCVDAGNRDAFHAALLEAIRQLGIERHGRSLEHDFLIGMAYLNGIDVEVDRKRAVELITGAAEAGFPAAIKQMVEMYRSGNSVERSYETAIRWQERLVALREHQFAVSGSERDALLLMDELMELAGCCNDIWDKAAELRACQRAWEIGEAAAAKTGSRNARSALASVCSKLGSVYHLERKFDEAWRCYTEALDLNQALWSKEQSKRLAIELSKNLERLGDICYARGRLGQAESYYQQALELSQTLYKMDQGVLERINLSRSHQSMGIVLRAQGKLGPAKDHYQEALAINEQLYDELGTLWMLQGVAESHNFVGNIDYSLGRSAEALFHYEKFVQFSRHLYERQGDALSKRDLSVGYGKLGNVFLDMGLPAKAEENFRESMRLAQQLAEETGTVEARRILGVSLERLGDAVLAQGQVDPAKQIYGQGLRVAEQIRSEVDTPESKRNPAILYEKLGLVAQREGDLAEAKRLHTASMLLRQQMLAQSDSPDARKGVLRSCTLLGSLCAQAGELGEAENHFKLQRTLLRQWVEDGGSIKDKIALKDTCQSLISLYQSQGRLAESVPCYQDCLDMYQQIWKETGDPDDRRALLLCCIDTGTVYTRMNNFAGARQLLQQAVMLARQIAEEVSTVESYDDLALAYTRLGIVSGASGRELVFEAYGIWDKLSQLVPDNVAFVQKKEYARQLLEQCGGKA